jgi:hypothetical protein
MEHPRPPGPGVFRTCFLVGVAVVAVAVVFFLGRLVHHGRLGSARLQTSALTCCHFGT